MIKLKAREIFDSNGRPTVEVELENEFGIFRDSAPSGKSTGKYEAVELRDEDGKGVSKAVENINKIIAPALENEDIANQKRIDKLLIGLDGTKNKSRLGANAMLPVSLTVCRAGAKVANQPLYSYISWNFNPENGTGVNLPQPCFNMVEGGVHSVNSQIAFQEFMAVPQKENFRDNLEIGLKIYKELKESLETIYGKEKIGLSSESAFSPPFANISEALDALSRAAKRASNDDVKIAIDAAASFFYENEKYKVDGKIWTKEELEDFYKKLIERYPIFSIEDPFEEESFDKFAGLTKEIGGKNCPYHVKGTLIFGDDLTVSNTERMQVSQKTGAINGVVLKPNQIGTITEILEAARLAKSYNWKIMVANRAGETEDDFIADLAVGVGADFIKSGAPAAKERMAKYNRLANIERELYPVK